MNVKLLSGYVLLVICIAVVTLPAVIVLMNTGDAWDLHVLYRTVTMSRASWLLVAAAGGIFVFLDLAWLLPRTVRQISLGLQHKKQKAQERMLQNLSDQSQAASTPSGSKP